MSLKNEWKPALWIAGLFITAYHLPVENSAFQKAVLSAFDLTRWYAQEHVLFCLVPAFFIAGVIAVFISQASVVKYFGGEAKQWLAYAIASVSGTILAVCSCTILPLFSGIHKRGAGLGPAIAFLYSGPAINILAIILTARILGFELGLARVVGAVLFSIVIGLAMQFIYRKDERDRGKSVMMPEENAERPLWQTAFHFFTLVFILIFLNWGQADSASGLWSFLFQYKFLISGLLGLLFAFSLVFVLKLKILPVLLGVFATAAVAFIWPARPVLAFSTALVALVIVLARAEAEPQDWLVESWGFAKQILPLLGAGVLVAGFLLGSNNGDGGIIPANWISGLVGGNSIFANFFASIAGAFMYFATLTEIPILQGLMNAGMGKGPALALLLAGPALSLPNMLVIRSVIGTQKTIVYVSLVVIMATLSGVFYGTFF